MSPLAHIVDDDEAIRDALTWLFRSRHVESRAWPSAEAFLADWREDLRGCLVLDVRMGGMSGLQLFDLLCERGSRLPVIFLSGHGDIPLAVAAGLAVPLAKSRNQRPFIAAGRFDADLHGRQRRDRFQQLTATIGVARIALHMLAFVDRHVPRRF
mgnify:CR=1 FL=1